ncbi:MAG: response regulator [Ignavibacteriales bacterium]|nr:MAG: response regulator [Ignavibacteriales bacterium]
MQPKNILLVEDNEGDILLTLEGLQESNKDHKVEVVKDGKAAIDYLNRIGEYANANSPDLILLDINLPKKTGIEVLKYIKTSEVLKHIPVIMLTTSSSTNDIRQAYLNYSNCYITKPVEADDFIKAVNEIDNFWTGLVSLKPV